MSRDQILWQRIKLLTWLFVLGLAISGATAIPLTPVRKVWLYTYGMIACVLVIPYAFVFSALRGIPFWWRLVDCSLGVFGRVPLWICRKWTRQLTR